MRGLAWGLAGTALTALLMLGCSRGPASARKHAPPPPADPWPTAVHRGMNRQVQVAKNAELAPSGDLEGDALRRAVLAAPANVEAREHLAAYYERTGQPELAIEHYRLLLGYQNDAATPRLELIRLLHSLNLNDQALAAANDGIALHATRALLSWKGILLDDLDRAPEAEPIHREALARAGGASPSTLAALHNNLGQNLLLQKRYPEAAASFQQALALNRRLETARNNLGMALAYSGDTPQALAHWKSLAGPATAHSNLAAIYIEQGKWQEARRELNIALGYDPNHAAALRNMAALSERDGQPAVLEPNRVHPPSTWARIAQALKKTLGANTSREQTDPTQAAQR